VTLRIDCFDNAINCYHKKTKKLYDRGLPRLESTSVSRGICSKPSRLLLVELTRSSWTGKKPLATPASPSAISPAVPAQINVGDNGDADPLEMPIIPSEPTEEAALDVISELPQGTITQQPTATYPPQVGIVNDGRRERASILILSSHRLFGSDIHGRTMDDVDESGTAASGYCELVPRALGSIAYFFCEKVPNTLAGAL